MDLHIAIDSVILGQIETHLSFFQTIVSTSKDILMPDTMSWVKGDLPISFSIPFQANQITAADKVPPVIPLAIDGLRQGKRLFFPSRDFSRQTNVICLAFRFEFRVIQFTKLDPVHIADGHPP